MRPAERRWSAAARAMFAAYIETRARHQPLECNLGTSCWVRDGPPSLSGNHGRNHHCLGCLGKPKPPSVVAKRAASAKC